VKITQNAWTEKAFATLRIVRAVELDSHKLGDYLDQDSTKQIVQYFHEDSLLVPISEKVPYCIFPKAK